MHDRELYYARHSIVVVNDSLLPLFIFHMFPAFFKQLDFFPLVQVIKVIGRLLTRWRKKKRLTSRYPIGPALVITLLQSLQISTSIKMKWTFAFAALLSSVVANPLPQSSAPSGCESTVSGTFEITAVNVTQSAKRSLEAVRNHHHCL